MNEKSKRSVRTIKCYFYHEKDYKDRIRYILKSSKQCHEIHFNYRKICPKTKEEKSNTSNPVLDDVKELSTWEKMKIAKDSKETGVIVDSPKKEDTSVNFR